jgi:hypothetical protein
MAIPPQYRPAAEAFTNPKIQPRLMRMLMSAGLNIGGAPEQMGSPAHPGDVALHPTTRNPNDPVKDSKGRPMKLFGDQLLKPNANGMPAAELLTARDCLGLGLDGKIYLTRATMVAHGFTPAEIEEAYDALAGNPKMAATLKQLHKLEIGEALRRGDLASLRDGKGGLLWPEADCVEVVSALPQEEVERMKKARKTNAEILGLTPAK